jgi:hypothetical protein
VYPKSQNKLPKDIEKGMLKKHLSFIQRNRLRQVKKKAISYKVTLEGAVSKDQDPLKRRIIPFLPDLLLFDLLVNIKQ